MGFFSGIGGAVIGQFFKQLFTSIAGYFKHQSEINRAEESGQVRSELAHAQAALKRARDAKEAEDVFDTLTPDQLAELFKRYEVKPKRDGSK